MTGNPEIAEGQGLKILALNTDRGVQVGASGYPRLLDFIPECQRVGFPRRDPRRFIPRLLTRLFGLGSASRWYRIGSFRTEIQALVQIITSPPDVVHVLWGDQDWGYIDRFVPRRTALVVTLHNTPELLKPSFRRVNALRRVDQFILMSPDQASFLEQLKIPATKWTFVPHGIDIDAFTPLYREPDSPALPFRVVHVGNYLRDFEQLAAITRDLKDHPIHFEIVCSAENRSAYEFGPNISWHHGISNEALVSLYQNCDVLLMAVSGATANNAILEGMACGLPIVSHDVGGLSAYMDASFATFVPRNGWEPLRDALLELIGNEERLGSARTAARKCAESLSWKEIAKATRLIYEAALSDRRERRVQRRDGVELHP
ncbi:MAG: glycosyltransferase [Verrucomicrobiaceae bacterium]|nr:MAG: glycosyltransferase [Verrucomicrobiaceae bacterium]